MLSSSSVLQSGSVGCDRNNSSRGPLTEITIVVVVVVVVVVIVVVVVVVVPVVIVI